VNPASLTRDVLAARTSGWQATSKDSPTSGGRILGERLAGPPWRRTGYGAAGALDGTSNQLYLAGLHRRRALHVQSGRRPERLGHRPRSGASISPGSWAATISAAAAAPVRRNGSPRSICSMMPATNTSGPCPQRVDSTLDGVRAVNRSHRIGPRDLHRVALYSRASRRRTISWPGSAQHVGRTDYSHRVADLLGRRRWPAAGRVRMPFVGAWRSLSCG